MRTIFYEYVSDLSEKSRRASALPMLLSKLELFQKVLSDKQLEHLTLKAMDFSEAYNKAWPWKKRKVITATLKEFNQNFQEIEL